MWKNNFALISPLVPFRINWLQTEFFVLNFGKWSMNIGLLCNNCLTGCLFLIKSSIADLQTCCPNFTQKVFWRDIWLLVTEICVRMFLFTQNLIFPGNVIFGMTRQYQWFLLKTCLSTKGCQGVLCLICWVCLKDSTKLQKDPEWQWPPNIA